MSTIDQPGDGPPVVHTKGAPEAVLSPLHPPAGLRRRRGGPGSAAAPPGGSPSERVCRRKGSGCWHLPSANYPPQSPRHSGGTTPNATCVWSGLIAMLDPPRRGVAESVAQCRAAGIRIIVITGDHPLTAAAIAERVGITGAHPTVVTGEQFERLTEKQLAALIREHPEVVFARASPRPSCTSPKRCAPRVMWSQ